MKCKGRTCILVLTCVLVMVLFVTMSRGYGENGVVFYRIGEEGQSAWAVVKQHFESRGYTVSLYQGEAVIEKHVEKANRINRGPGNVFLAVELIPGEKSHVMVARPEVKKGEGRFLTIDEIPGQFARESEKLATAVAAVFQVKPKHLPLFPLLGISMPGILIRAEFKEEDTRDVVNKICNGVEKYFSERTGK